MTNIQTALLALAIFAALVLGYAVVRSLSAAWERNGQRGTGRTVGRIELIGFRYR